MIKDFFCKIRQKACIRFAPIKMLTITKTLFLAIDVY